MESYEATADIFEYWSYGTEREYNSMTLSTDVSSQGGEKSIKMHYKGVDSISYVRATPFATTVTAKGICIDVKGDGKATMYINLNWRVGTSLLKMRYTLTNIPTTWTHYEIGFNNFKDINGSTKIITLNDAKNVETISFGLVNSGGESDVYVDNMRFLRNINYSTNTITAID